MIGNVKFNIYMGDDDRWRWIGALKHKIIARSPISGFESMNECLESLGIWVRLIEQGGYYEIDYPRDNILGDLKS